MYRFTLAITDDLNLHVAGVFKKFFQVHGAITEKGFGLRLGDIDGLEQGSFIVHHAHAATTTTGGSLDDDRVADLPRQFQGAVGVIIQWAIGTRYGRHTGFPHDFDSGDLVAHLANGLGAGTNKYKAAVLHLFGKIRIFRQEAIAGMHSIGIGHFHGTDNGRNIEIALGGAGWADANGFIGKAHMHQVFVGNGVHGHCLDAQLLAGTQNPKCYFAAIGDKNFI